MVRKYIDSHHLRGSTEHGTAILLLLCVYLKMETARLRNVVISRIFKFQTQTMDNFQKKKKTYLMVAHGPESTLTNKFRNETCRE
jgi:hypothetical protein